MQPPVDKRRADARARARIARELHPDLGGDPQQYLAAMEELDRGVGRRTGAPVLVRGTLRGKARSTSRRLRRRIHELQRKRSQRVL